MRPARIFLIIQLSNSRAPSALYRGKTVLYGGAAGLVCGIFGAFMYLTNQKCYTNLSLTVVGRKNRCIPYIYWAAAIFIVVSNYSNLFLPFAFFLDCSHFTFGYELVVCPETAGFMKIIRDLFPPIQWDEPLLLYPGKVHRF